MLTTRLLWFTLGFSVTGASIAHLGWRDLYAQQYALSSDTKEKFHVLEARVSGLELAASENHNPNLAQSFLHLPRLQSKRKGLKDFFEIF